MTMNNEDINMVIVGEQEELPPSVTTAASTNEEGLHIIEEDEFNTESDIIQSFENNRELLESFGGLEIIGIIIDLSEEEFETLKSELLNLYLESLNDPLIEKDLKRIVEAENLNSDIIEKEFTEGIKIIDSIDDLSSPKKYFIKTVFTMTAEMPLSSS